MLTMISWDSLWQLMNSISYIVQGENITKTIILALELFGFTSIPHDSMLNQYLLICVPNNHLTGNRTFLWWIYFQKIIMFQWKQQINSIHISKWSNNVYMYHVKCWCQPKVGLDYSWIQCINGSHFSSLSQIWILELKHLQHWNSNLIPMHLKLLNFHLIFYFSFNIILQDVWRLTCKLNTNVPPSVTCKLIQLQFLGIKYHRLFIQLYI